MRRDLEKSRLTCALMCVAAGTMTSISMDARAAHSVVDAERTDVLEEIVITGSRLRTREPEGASPVTVFDRDSIDRLGTTTVAQTLAYLPQQPYTQSEFYRSDSAQFAELRGIGADTTLVLINGRRTVPSAASSASNAFDLNSIPLAAVDRIEVLSDAASAVYGADAVGGVVNIILKRGMAEPVVQLRYGSAEGGAAERRYSLAAGVDGERLRGSVIVDYLDRSELLGEERDRWRNQDYRRFGSIDWRSASSNPGNIETLSGENLPGLNAPNAAVPAGSRGENLSPADFAATAGQQNLTSLARDEAIVPASERLSVAAFGEYEFRPNYAVFMEGLYAKRRLDSSTAPASLEYVEVPASNAFNPFGLDLTTNYLFESLGRRRSTVESELARGVLGVRGLLGSWDWEIATLATRERASSWIENGVDATRVSEALASSDPDTALNVFQDGPGGSQALLSSLRAVPDRAKFESSGAWVSGFARGELFSLPAGSVQAVIGGEWHRDGIEYDRVFVIDEDRQSRAAFAELEVPLVVGWPGMERLTLKLAARYDDYSDFGETVNPQYGLVWKPISDLTLRASYGTSFRPPSLFELYAPRIQVPLPVPDPARNGETSSAIAFSGGNPNLNPIEGESWTAGFVWTPVGFEGLRVSASWWQITLKKRVSFVPYQTILAYESLFADRVVRAPATPADVAAGLPGRLQSLDISRINYGSLDTSGIDASASYAMDFGSTQLITSLGGTWVHDYRSHDLPDAPAVERVGIASVYGTIARWRATASADLIRGALSAGLTARLTADYDDAIGVPGVATGRRIHVPRYFDVRFGWDADGSTAKGIWRGVRLSIGATNVTDEEAPFAEIGLNTGVDMSQSDLRGRFVYADLSKRF